MDIIEIIQLNEEEEIEDNNKLNDKNFNPNNINFFGFLRNS